MYETSVTYLSVINKTTPATGFDAVDDLTAGSGGFFASDLDAPVTTALDAATEYYFAWKDSAGVLHKSPYFFGGEISNATEQIHVELTEQVSTLTLAEALDNTYYGLKIVLRHTAGMLNNSPLTKTIPFKTGTAATVTSLAEGLVTAAATTFGRGMNQDIIFTSAVGVITMTGSTPTSFNAATDTPYVVSFDVLTGDFPGATVEETTSPSVGSGTYGLVAAMEAYTQFQDKDKYISAYPAHNVRIDAVSGSEYTIFAFELADKSYISPATGINPISKGLFLIAADETAAATDIAAFSTVLGT